MSNFGLIEENMELSHIHLAVISSHNLVPDWYVDERKTNSFLDFPISKNPFDQKNPTCLSRGYSPLSGIYGHTTVYNSAMHSFYVYGGVSYSAGRVQVSNALFVLHYPTRRWSVVSTGCHKNTEKWIFSGFSTKLTFCQTAWQPYRLSHIHPKKIHPIIIHKLWSNMDGTQLLWLPWFPAKN